MRALYQDTPNLAEPAGAAAFAGLMQERGQMQRRIVGVGLTGANLDLEVFREVPGNGLHGCYQESHFDDNCRLVQMNFRLASPHAPR